MEISQIRWRYLVVGVPEIIASTDLDDPDSVRQCAQAFGILLQAWVSNPLPMYSLTDENPPTPPPLSAEATRDLKTIARRFKSVHTKRGIDANLKRFYDWADANLVLIDSTGLLWKSNVAAFFESVESVFEGQETEMLH
jgi:hypothetical protein